jgi:hypothetical protein
MSQFNLYLERVQENRNYQDLEVYEESKVGLGIAALLITALSYGGLSGVKNYIDNKAALKSQDRMTQIGKYAAGNDFSPQQSKAIDELLQKIYKNKGLDDEHLKALKDHVNYNKLSSAQQENFNFFIAALRNEENFKNPYSFNAAFKGVFKTITGQDYSPHAGNNKVHIK